MTQISGFDVSYELSPVLLSILAEFARAKRAAKKLTSKPAKRRAPSYFGWTRKKIFAEKCRLVHRLYDPKIGEGDAVLPGVQFPSKQTHKGASVLMHKAVLSEIPAASVALRVRNAKLGGLFATSQTLRNLMTEERCAEVYTVIAAYAKKPKDVTWQVWNEQKDEAVGAIVREAIQQVIGGARYVRQDAPMADVIKVRNALEFLAALPALAKVKIIKVKRFADDDQQKKRGRRASAAATK